MTMTKIKPDYFTFRTDDYRFCRAGKFDGNWERASPKKFLSLKSQK